MSSFAKKLPITAGHLEGERSPDDRQGFVKGQIHAAVGNPTATHHLYHGATGARP